MLRRTQYMLQPLVPVLSLLYSLVLGSVLLPFVVAVAITRKRYGIFFFVKKLLGVF